MVTIVDRAQNFLKLNHKNKFYSHPLQTITRKISALQRDHDLAKKHLKKAPPNNVLVSLQLFTKTLWLLNWQTMLAD